MGICSTFRLLLSFPIILVPRAFARAITSSTSLQELEPNEICTSVSVSRGIMLPRRRVRHRLIWKNRVDHLTKNLFPTFFWRSSFLNLNFNRLTTKLHSHWSPAGDDNRNKWDLLFLSCIFKLPFFHSCYNTDRSESAKKRPVVLKKTVISIMTCTKKRVGKLNSSFF